MRFLPFLLSLVTLAVSLPLEIRDNIPMPQDDPFYTPPAGYESAKVGDILASRSVKIAAFSKLPQNLKAAYQLLYRTVDINGNPAATVQTVMVPYNARKGPMRILSYQAAEDSVSLHCAPSYQFQLDTVGDNGSMQLEIINVDHALGSGYITLVPDYEGLSSAFTVGPLAATGVLDGIRAALNFQTVIPNKTDTQLAMVGYSGGGLATAWASQLASTYAPELTFVGVAEGGVPVNLENSIDQVNKGQNAGEIASALVGVSQVYPDVQKYIADHLYPNGTEAFAKVKDQCIGKDLTQFQFQDIFSYFTVTEDEFKAADPIRKVFNATLLGQPGSPLPQMPLYIYHSVNDEIVNGADEDEYVNDLCARGIKSLHSERELVGGHISLAVTGDAQAFTFLEDRFNGKPPVPGCTIVNTTTSLADPLNAVVFGATLLDFLKGLLGLPIAYLGPA